MKSHHKKLFISGTALTVAGILGIGGLMQTSVSVQASAAMMPGIETIINETSKDEPFRILEIVDEQKEAEIGYYVSGQEPYFKLYKFPIEVEQDYRDDSGNTTVYNNITTVQDVLSRLMTAEQRRDFMQNTKQSEENQEEDITTVSDEIMTDRTGIKNIRSICNPDVNGPLSYIPYKETYFPNEEQVDWQQVDLAKVRKVQLNGTYEKSSTGVGDYSREDLAFYPIRKGTVDSDKSSAKYRENIESFSYSMEGKTQPYEVEFQGIDNQSVTNELIKDYYENHMGLYTNVYGYLTSTTNPKDFQKFPGEDLDNPFWEASENISADEALQTEELTLDAEEIFNDGENFASGDTGEVDFFSDSDSDGADSFSDASSVAGSINPKIYRDEEIDYFPFHRYREVGTYSEVMSKLNTENAETVFEDDSIFDAGESGEVSGEDTFYSDSEGTYYWRNPDAAGADQRLVYVIGREKQPYSNTQALVTSDNGDTGIPYYYFIKRYGLACELSEGGTASNPDDYRYTGWYYAVNPANEERFILAGENETSHFYASDEEFTLTPGKGEYDFKPDESAQSMDVQVNHFYYSGGYTNHDWLKQYVFNLHPDTEDETERSQFANFVIEVDTITTDEFNKEYGNVEVASEEPQLSAEQQSIGDGTDFIEGSGEIQEEDVPHIQRNEGTGDAVETDEVGETDETGVNNEAVGPNETGENQAVDETNGSIENGQESVVEPLVSEAQEELVGFEVVEDEGELSSPEEEGESAQWPDGGSEPDSVDMETSDVEFSDSEDLFTSEEQSDSEELFTSEEQSGYQQSIFSSGEEVVKNELDKYDLIYINGKLLSEAAQVLTQGAASKAYACIINQGKVIENDGVSMAFSDYKKPDDVDQHYVTQNVYFFNNVDTDTDTDGNKIVPSLVNLEFNMSFNPENIDLMEGFEEIQNYIETENQYRLVGTSGKEDNNEIFSDESYKETGTGVELSDGTKLLSTHISQARVVEYIINYKYKRPEKMKDKISVLDIEPGKTNNQLTAGKVNSWIYNIGFVNAGSCCYRQGQGETKFLIDNNRDTSWMNDINQSSKHTHEFWVEIVGNPSLLKGVIFTPRQDERYDVGYPTKYKIEILDQGMKKVLATYEGESDYKKQTAKQDIEIKFRSKLPNASKYVRFSFEKTYTESSMAVVAACGELSPIIDESASKLPQITVSNMTSSEYVGHIDDINAKYDLIYIGNQLDKHNKLINGNNSEMLYTHIGGTVLAYENGDKKNKLQYLGLLDTEYETTNENGDWFYSANVKGLGTRNIHYSKRFKPISEYNDGTNGGSGTGSFRGSGNDITKQQYKELMDFVKSGYSVVLGEELVTAVNGKKVISSDKVDKASYFYQFMSEAIDYPNVIWEKELEDESSNIFFFSNLSKPEIVFSEDNGKPLEPPRKDDKNTTQLGEVGYVDGKLQYIFTIKDDAAISPANTTYDCQLYLDLDFDGNLSDLEEQEKYIEIRNKNGEVLPQVKYGEGDLRYQLKAGEQYTLIRNLPEDYFKIITWKLEISNNLNTYIRTSETGYAKQKGNSSVKQVINVLQIRPNDKEQVADGAKYYGTWDLSDSGTFKDLIKDIEDFTINVQVMQIKDYANYEKNTGESLKELLDTKQIVIIGFDDSYKNIPNDSGQVDNLLDFIRSGKSVIFSHDTTSYINWDYEEFYNKVARNAYDESTGQGDINVMSSTWLWEHAGNPKWGLSLNKVLRSIVGMDRYGIVTGEPTDTLSNNGTMTVADLLKRGKWLQDGETVTFGDTQETVSFARLQQLAGDVAYVTGDEERKSSYPQTHGYSNIQLEPVNFGSETTQIVTKVNDGAITQYPYRMGNTLTVASTHAQDLQLSLERDRDINGISDGKNDIVVWYCLGGENAYYSGSPNDVRNYYYFYSKGNVIYTGAGHRNVTNEEEIKLFINAIVAAANVTAVQPEVDFVKSLNPAAEVESVRYYMTDRDVWLKNESNVLEKDMEFYFNIMDYNMVSATLSGKDQKNQQMTVEFYIEDEEGDIEVDGHKLKSITDEIHTLVPYGEPDSAISVTKVEQNKPGKFYLDKNNAYGLQIKGIESYLTNGDDQSTGKYKSNLKLYIKATSTVTIFDKTSDKSSWAVLNLKQRQLFDLD